MEIKTVKQIIKGHFNELTLNLIDLKLALLEEGLVIDKASSPFKDSAYNTYQIIADNFIKHLGGINNPIEAILDEAYTDCQRAEWFLFDEDPSALSIAKMQYLKYCILDNDKMKWICMCEIEELEERQESTLSDLVEWFESNGVSDC